MDYDSWLIIAASLLFSAFFSGMEIAFVSANKLKVELDAKQGTWAAALIGRFFTRPKLFIASMLVGNNLALVVYGLFAGRLIAELMFGTPDWGDAQSPYLALSAQTLISTVVILVTAEFLPKSIFRVNPNSWLRLFSLPLAILYYILLVPAWLVTGFSNFFLKYVVRATIDDQIQDFGTVDLDHYLREITDRMDPDQDLEHEIQILQNALDFSQLKARECLVPRNEIIAMGIDDDLSVLRSKFIQTGLSKMVIYRDTIDNIIGYVHVRDIFKRPESIKSVLMPAFIVPEPMAANEVLELFIKKKRNLAVVVDEFGGTSGILTIEDIVEEIFGDIEDEHDKEDLVEIKISEEHFQFSGRLEIDYINETYDLELPESDEYETLGGLIIHHTEEIPSKNDTFKIEDFLIKILQVSDTRIELIDLQVMEEQD